MSDTESLAYLSSQFGIESEYTDIWGNKRPTSDETRLAFLRSMGVKIDNPEASGAICEALEIKFWKTWLDPVLVVTHANLPARITIRLPSKLTSLSFTWVLNEETGRTQTGNFHPTELKQMESRTLRSGEAFISCQLTLPVNPPLGYHRFSLLTEVEKKRAEATMALIVTPNRCFIPEALSGDGRVWGPAVQLYALRSERNWGIGDFTDLITLIKWCGNVGTSLVGLNPMHALFPYRAKDASPYSPSSRLAFNILYLDVEKIDDLADCKEVRTRISSPEFQKQLQTLRAETYVNYTAVADIKLPILKMLYQCFRQNHLVKNSERARQFRDFQREGGKNLDSLVLFEALQEFFSCQDPTMWGWPVWPESYRDPQSRSVRDWAAANRERIEFYHYLQWLTQAQIKAAANCCSAENLPIGLYLDLSVSVERGGAEVWTNQSLYTFDASVGAPPDDLNSNGQNWGLPALIPERLRQAAYLPFTESLRHNMRYAGALRIDHVMQLTRLFWIPRNTNAQDGAYVDYPFDDLIGILALESHRNKCLVIGEDLGTVPDELRAKLHTWGVFSYKVFYFEKVSASEFRAPRNYVDQAVVTLGSHDLPTLSGYWENRDLAVRAKLNLFPNEVMQKRIIEERAADRKGILTALEREDLLPNGLTADPTTIPEINLPLCSAIHHFLARTPCKIQLIQFEDIIGEKDQINLPGTTDQHPNWRRKLNVGLEEISRDSRICEITRILQAERSINRKDTVK